MITYHTESGSPVVEITVTGEVTNRDLEAAMGRLRADLEQNGKNRLIETIAHFTGVEPAALWTDVKLGIPLAGKVDRVAVVADQAWIRAVTHLGRLFTKAEIKSFAPTELAEARTWISRA